jgi:hypothetical protein
MVGNKYAAFFVTRFDTHVALERVKVGLSLPVAADTGRSNA